MSNSLGTLWFGADIDLTALKNKINQGNQSILDALKMNYDPASYTQMVSKLKSELAKETFEIKIDTNAQQIRQQLNQTVNSINNTKAPNLNFGGINGIHAMTNEILNQRDAILDNKKAVQYLKEEWGRAINQFGRKSVQAMSAFNVYDKARTDLRKANWELESLNITKGRASLSQKVLNEQMREAQKAAKQWNSDHMRLNATLAGGIHVSTQLGSALSSLFAIDAARQFLGYVIEIGGQLEKQRISIGAILGDTVKANHLFEQIKGLALKSPFGVVELDQYTKQLSAYGFKYNELYDMTKRLADISAGAGQDIGRLTLALGHVRSATYLTGITLRQFSMNNIPMLKMLADYYSEVEKRAVSTAEVQQRISKRQVSYEDVIEQIRRLTDEGGMFYNMQEKISESLAARYKNLKDAMDIMYGEMAEGSVGDALKGLANVLLKTTRHWKEIINVMGVAAVAFAIGKMRIGLNTVTMQGNTAATLKQIMATKQLEANNLRAASSYRTLTQVEQGKILSATRLTAQDISLALATNQLTKDEVLNAIAIKKVHAAEAQALVTTGMLTQAEVEAALATNAWSARLSVLGGKLKNAFAGIGWGTWLTFGAMAGMELYMAVDQWNQKIDDKAKDIKDLIKSRINDLKKMKDSLDEEGKPSDSTALKNRIEEMKQVLADSEAYTVSIDEQVTKAGSLNEQYDILSGAIEKATEKNRKMLNVQDDVAKMIKASSIGNAEGVFNHGFWEFPLVDFFFNDDITKNMEQTLNSYTTLRKVIDGAWEYKDAIKGVIEEMKKSGEITDEFAAQLKNAPFEEQIRLLAESGYWQKIKDEVTSQYPDFLNFSDNIIKASNDVTKRWQEIANDDIPKMLKKEAERRGISERELHKWCLDNIDDFKIMLDGIADQLDIKEPAIRERLKRLFYSYVKFSKLAEGNVSQENIENTERDLMNYLGVEDENLRKLLGLDPLATIKDSNTETSTGGDKKDKLLKIWQDRYDALKTYYDEVQKYVKLGYDVESAMQKVKELGLGDSAVFKGLDATKENYAKLLKELREEIKSNASTIEREKLDRKIGAALGDFDRNGTKELMDKNVSIMKDYISKIESQWKLYRDVMKKTGGNQDIARLAFEDGKIWDEAAKLELEKFNKLGAERGVIPIEFRWDMNESEFKEALKDINGKTQDDLVELALNIQKIIRSNYQNFINNTADAYSKSLTEQQKLNELIRERIELEERLQHANTEEQRSGLRIQLEAKNREITKQQWSAFKEGNDWGRVFGNLDRMSLETIKKMITAMKNYANTTEMSVEETKAWYEAMEKLTDQAAILDPINEIINAIKDYNTAIKKINAVDQNIEQIKNSDDLTSEQKQEIINALEKDRARLLDDEASALTRVNKAVKSFASRINNLGESLSRLGNSIGGDFGNIIGGFGSMISTLGSSMQTISEMKDVKGFSGVVGNASAILAIASAGIELNKQLANVLPYTENLYERYAEKQKEINQLQDAVNSYSMALTKARQEERGWISEDPLTELNNQYELHSDAAYAYYSKLNELQEKYIESSGTLSKSVLPILEGIAGVVAGIVITVGSYGTATVAAAAVAGAALGAASGQLHQASYDALTYSKNLVTARQNLKALTQTGSFWRGEKTQNLEEWVRKNIKDRYGNAAELFNEEGLINIEVAQAVLDSGQNLAGETRETLQKLIALREDFDEWEKAVKDYVSSSFAPLADAMTDAIWDWLDTGENALDRFRNYANDTFKNVAKDAVKSFLKVTVLDKFEKQLLNLYEQFSATDSKGNRLMSETDLMTNVANIAGQIGIEFESILPVVEQLAETINTAFRAEGYDVVSGSGNDSSISNSIRGITEQTADILTSYINAIRADVSVDRAMITLYYPQFLSAVGQVSVLSQTQVTLQTQIAANTLRNAEAADKIYNILHESQTGAIRLKVS